MNYNLPPDVKLYYCLFSFNLSHLEKREEEKSVKGQYKSGRVIHFIY